MQVNIFDTFPEDRRAALAGAVRGRVHTFRPGKIHGGPWTATPWNIAQSLRYVHRQAARQFFRYRHGPALDGVNTFEIVEFS